MKKKGLLLGLGWLLVGLLLAGCAAPPEIIPVMPPPTPAVVAGAAAGAGEDQPMLAVASRFPLPVPVHEEVIEADSTNCIECHTIQEDLQELAEEPEEEEHLSEGEG